MNTLDATIARIERARLKFGAHHIVHLVAISKYSSAEQVADLYTQGQRAFGESKVQDLIQKQEILAKYPIDWHFIGNIQTNKINKLIDLEPSLIHSVDSYKTAVEINKRLQLKCKIQNALLQINSAKELSKSGVNPDEANEIYHQIQSECKNINLIGVMSIGAHTNDHKIIKNSFETTRKIYENLKSAQFCSMGMSSDFELAIECGSNMLRLGSILFE